MQDSKRNEIKVGQDVIFTVNTSILTGTVVKIRDRKYYHKTIPTIKIQLNPPEEVCRWRWVDIPDVPEDAPWTERHRQEKIVLRHNMFREVSDSERILIVKDVENNA